MVDSEVDAERRYLLRVALEANFRSLSSVSIAAPFNALVIALPLWGHGGWERVGGFVLLIAANSALNWWLRAAYLRRRSEAALEVWARVRVLSAALSGCVWGVGAATLLWVPARLDLQVYALVIVCLTTVGALASSAVFFPAFVAYATCCVAPVVVRFAVERDAPHSATAIELSVLLLVLLIIGRSMSQADRKRSLLTNENERLIAHLKSAEERLTNANRTLNERVEERTSQLARAIEEKHQSDLQLLRAQKMEAIGRLAGGVAHDFNNVLTAIMGSATLLREMLPERARAEREEADEIIKGADRAARLTSQLLTLARGGQGQAVHVDLNQRLKQLSHLLRRAVGEGMHLELVTGEAQLVVTIDPGQFDQLVMNLVLNAKDASEPGKTILVSIEPGPDPINEQARRALIRVKDEGSGITPEVVEHIFEPFFTTKGERGTGLGLSTSFAIVQRAQGLITVDSSPGRGTCFNVSLPIV